MVELKAPKTKRNPAVILYVVVPVLIAAALLFLSDRNKTGKPGSHAVSSSLPASFEDTVQKAVTGGEKKKVGEYDVRITYKYSYELCGLAVSTHNYPGTGIGNRLAPKDVAMAWGDVARNNDKIDFHWSQSGRWYHWSASSNEEIAPVGGITGVNTHSANNHLIAADDDVAGSIKHIKEGDYVVITGYLVDIYAEDDSGRTFTWNSSTSRNDTGDGACEVIYVTEVKWL